MAESETPSRNGLSVKVSEILDKIHEMLLGRRVQAAGLLFL